LAEQIRQLSNECGNAAISVGKAREIPQERATFRRYYAWISRCFLARFRHYTPLSRRIARGISRVCD